MGVFTIAFLVLCPLSLAPPIIANMYNPVSEAMPDKEDMLIKFDGQTHQIEANTLINSLIHFTTVVHEVNNSISNGEKVVVNIKAHNEGSFEVLLNIAKDVANAAQTLFSITSMGYVAGLIDAVSGVYSAYQFLKGDKPKHIESIGNGMVKVENNNGNINYYDQRVINIVQGNQVVRGAISQGFDTLNDDLNVTGLEFVKGGKNLLEVQRDEFPTLAAGNSHDELQKDERIETQHGAMLRIVRLSFDPRMKSDFLFAGNKITAWIADNKFYEDIDRGEPFRKGDVLECDLEIKQQYDPTIDAYVNKSYKLIKIDQHHPRSEQRGIE